MDTNFFSDLLLVFDQWNYVPFLKGGLLIFIGILLGKVVSNAAGRATKKHLEPQYNMLLRKSIYYLILGIFLVSGLREFGFSLEVLLGAAGILTVAIGFASQTSASNLISGLFLIAERPFSVGDIIKVGNSVGEVLSIDLLSVKIRTFDNLFVRVPNETMLKADVVNYTKFPIRRFDFIVGIAYKEDIERVRNILFDVAEKNIDCLIDPKPLFIVDSFNTSSIDLKFCVWVKREKYLDLRNSILHEIKERFDKEGVEIPFPHLSLYTGSVSTPFPIQIVSENTNRKAMDTE